MRNQSKMQRKGKNKWRPESGSHKKMSIADKRKGNRMRNMLWENGLESNEDFDYKRSKRW